jgi:hypothetical protein
MEKIAYSFESDTVKGVLTEKTEQVRDELSSIGLCAGHVAEK